MKVELLYFTPIKTMINGLCMSYGKSPEDYEGREEEALAKCLSHANVHTMPLEMSFIQFRIETKIAVSRELNRHRPLKIVERSTRYVGMTGEDIYVTGALKRELEEIADKTGDLFVWHTAANSYSKYRELVEDCGISKQFARDLLPLLTKTEETVSGSLWDWIKFIKARLHKTAHPDIQEIAKEIYQHLNNIYPLIVNKKTLEAVHKLELEVEA